MENLLLCPKCRAPLDQKEKSLVCAAGHTYDIARQGYVNLLLGNIASHGDNREMIAARRRFLEGGHYAALRDTVAQRVALELPAHGVLLDAGCGECYYTAGVANACAALGKPVEIFGFDVSKEAILAGCRRRCGKLFTASSYDIPLPEKRVDVVLSLFAPLAAEEFGRVLREKGLLVLAVPDRRHLWGLKRVLYETPYENEPQEAAPSGFLLEESISVEKTVVLQGQETISDLFSMTPYYYRTPKEGRERLAALSELETEISFRLLLCRKAR